MKDLNIVSTKDLLKVYYSSYECILISIIKLSVNVGDYKIKFTNKDVFYTENLTYCIESSDFEAMYNLKKVLLVRLDNIVKCWNKLSCNYSDFESYLQEIYQLSNYNYKRLLKLKQ